MSLHPDPIGPVPAETARVARAAFPKGHLCLTIRDRIGVLFDDEMFAPLFSARGRSAEAPWRLALVCVLQFVEGLSDRQAAEAVRDRLAWKYLLGLELTDPGFHYSVLSEFRDRLIVGGLELRLLDTMLAQFTEHGWLKARGAQRTDSTHVLSAVRVLNRIETVGETLRAALNALAVVAPDWLRAQAAPEWFDRYGVRVEEQRLPKGREARQTYAATVGADGMRLLVAVYAPDAPPYLRHVPAVAVLRRVWLQQYVVEDGRIRWRTADELPPVGARYDSPYDTDAHYAVKRQTSWTGYKVHVTETCDADTPHLITHVETTPAHIADAALAAPIQDALVGKGLPPAEHLLDAGYVDADLLVESKATQGIDVIGPVRPDVSWQAQEDHGFDSAHFAIDWEAHRATCPRGKVSTAWKPHSDPWGNPVSTVRFRRTDCRLCDARPLCTRSVGEPRQLTLRPQADHEALLAVRRRQKTPEWQQSYARRAGIEGTLSQGIRAFELRQTRYIGLKKTQLQHILTAMAVNVVRLAAWLDGGRHAKTRVSHFAALAPVAA